MKFIVDESTGMGVVEFLRAIGHDVISVGETMARARDLDVLACASADERVLITNDKDFGELVFRSGRVHSGVILLRLHDDRPESRIRVIKTLLKKHGNRMKGNFSVISENQIRIRHFSKNI